MDWDLKVGFAWPILRIRVEPLGKSQVRTSYVVNNAIDHLPDTQYQYPHTDWDTVTKNGEPLFSRAWAELSGELQVGRGMREDSHLEHINRLILVLQVK